MDLKVAVQNQNGRIKEERETRITRNLVSKKQILLTIASPEESNFFFFWYRLHVKGQGGKKDGKNY